MKKPLFGVSGSTILSDPAQYESLFWDGIDTIEIGEFPDEEAFRGFLALTRKNQIPYGVHSPLVRSGSKYDLIMHVQMEPDTAWVLLEQEMKQLSNLGAQYVLVHFPYFKEHVPETIDVNEMIEDGLYKLHRLQEKYGMPIVCEPKLGLNRSPAGIEYLHRFPLEIWRKYKLKLCIDVGDYLMATGEQALTYIAKWKEHIKIIHLHNVDYVNDKYVWIPIHPSHEQNGIQYKLANIIEFLASCEDTVFVFEHTPHSNPSDEFVQCGYQWVRELVEKVRGSRAIEHHDEVTNKHRCK